ncbi:MAG: 23S rRNA (adenine(2503)-C(2))-methyltransferase RlmN [Balneolales bacterium]
MQKTDIKSLTKTQIEGFCEQLGLKRYRSDQIFQWLFQKQARSVADMTNLSKALRDELDQKIHLTNIDLAGRQESKDGTIKFLFRLHDNHLIEAVLIPEFYDDGVANRLTVCISSQVGCVFGCAFCATGKMGYFRSLITGEIVDQLQYINKISLEKYGKKINNVVYMGMGEPLHNYDAVINSARVITDPLSLALSPRRITISTVGLTKRIRQMGNETLPFNLAISLHAASDEKRDKIMPINASMNLKSLREALTYYHKKTGQPVTYEYLLFDEFNDSATDANLLANIVKWIPSKVNIIMYNNVAGVELQRARETRLDNFIRTLRNKDITATVRRSRGDDIDAGCGQLAIREGQPKGKSMSVS